MYFAVEEKVRVKRRNEYAITYLRRGDENRATKNSVRRNKCKLQKDRNKDVR